MTKAKLGLVVALLGLIAIGSINIYRNTIELKNLTEEKQQLKEDELKTRQNYQNKKENVSKNKKIDYETRQIKASKPELVSDDNDDLKTIGVNYAEMTVVLTKAIQQQQKIIKRQQNQIDKLKIIVGLIQQNRK